WQTSAATQLFSPTASEPPAAASVAAHGLRLDGADNHGKRRRPMKLPGTLRVLRLGGLLLAAVPGLAAAFTFADVTARAQQLAARPYQPPAPIPQWLHELSYDQWRDIRFRPEHALWRGEGLPFEVQFFHPGL